MSKSLPWLSLARDVPRALIEETSGKPYRFESGDNDDNVLEIPDTLDRMHNLARTLLNERVHYEAEKARVERAIERSAQDLKRVQDAIDAKLQEIGMRGVTDMRDQHDR